MKMRGFGPLWPPSCWSWDWSARWGHPRLRRTAGGKTSYRDGLATEDARREPPVRVRGGTICLNTYDYLLRPKSPAELTVYTLILATCGISQDGKADVQAPPNVKFASGTPSRRRTSVHLHAAQEREGTQLAMTPGRGAGRRSADREDDLNEPNGDHGRSLPAKTESSFEARQGARVTDCHGRQG
jgi:hypothetical protein